MMKIALTFFCHCNLKGQNELSQTPPKQKLINLKKFSFCTPVFHFSWGFFSIKFFSLITHILCQNYKKPFVTMFVLTHKNVWKKMNFLLFLLLLLLCCVPLTRLPFPNWNILISFFLCENWMWDVRRALFIHPGLDHQQPDRRKSWKKIYHNLTDCQIFITLK